MAVRLTARGIQKAVLVQQVRTVLGRHLPLVSKSGDTERRESILSRSSLLLQDGLDIKELPVVIRKMDFKEVPFLYIPSSMNNVANASPEDEDFKVLMKDCTDVREVFKLLEVPGEKVTPYSAVFALNRVLQLQQAGAETIDTFIRKAILHELYETATSKISTLGNDTVITLVQCYLRATNRGATDGHRINEEIEKRIGDNSFSIAEVCELIEVFSLNPNSDSTLLHNLWIHVGSRYVELNEKSIPLVYSKLRYLNPDYKYILNMLDKQLTKFWWRLSGKDISLILQNYALLNHYSVNVLSLIGKWMFMNIHSVQDEDLLQILACFIRFKFYDANLIKALERYVSRKVTKMDKTLVGLVMDYCCQRRHLSTKIFDAVAKDFMEQGDSYKTHQILYTLRPYGCMNYVPSNSIKFFTKIEDVLLSKFSDFQAGDMVDLLASFVFVEKMPVNFLNKVFTPHFIAQIQTTEGRYRKNAVKNLIYLWTTLTLELPRHGFKYKLQDVIGWTSARLEGSHVKFHQQVGNVLHSMINSDLLREAEIAQGTPYFIDYEIHVDEDKNVLHVDESKGSQIGLKRLALVTIMPRHCCANTGHLLGEYALKRRHLKKMGYTVIDVFYSEFMMMCHTQEAKTEYLESLLRKHIHLTPVKNNQC